MLCFSFLPGVDTNIEIVSIQSCIIYLHLCYLFYTEPYNFLFDLLMNMLCTARFVDLLAKRHLNKLTFQHLHPNKLFLFNNSNVQKILKSIAKYLFIFKLQISVLLVKTVCAEPLFITNNTEQWDKICTEN